MGLEKSSYKSSEEIQKEAEKYPITTFADILKALKEHPDWLERNKNLKSLMNY